MTTYTNASDGHQTFEAIRQHSGENGEFWSARDIAQVLQYSKYENFLSVIDKAKTACDNSGESTSEHFVSASKTVNIGSDAQREVDDYLLSRYACYLIIQNADPAKAIVAYGQTYFAIQTRRQELAEDAKYQKLDEDKKRVLLRNELREHNKQLVEAARQAGVVDNLDFAIFQNHGYKGLYGGLDAKALHHRKGLKKSESILDHMGSTELAANLFRATQTEEKLRRDKITGKENANRAHYEVGSKVRQTIEELGGTMPEALPTPEVSVKKIERQHRITKKKGRGAND